MQKHTDVLTKENIHVNVDDCMDELVRRRHHLMKTHNMPSWYRQLKIYPYYVS